MGRLTARQRAMRALAAERQRDESSGQFMSRPEEMPDGDDEWPEPTDSVTNGTEEDEDLVWIVDDNEKEGEEDEEDGEDELRSQEGRLDAVAPELAQFVNLFEQDTTHRKLFKSGFTVHLNRSARDDFVKASEELKRVANLAGQRMKKRGVFGSGRGRRR